MSDSHERIALNFKKAHTHITKIVEMLEAREYCVDIMQQNLAVIGLLKSAHQMLMEDHLHTCFSHAMQTDNKKRKEEMVEEILRVSKMAQK